MTIVVMSSDKNRDTFFPFSFCIEMFWKTHPEIVYSTESIKNPYYKTICKNYPLSHWSKRIRETIKEIDDEYILIMCDDIFLRENVDVKKINSLYKYFKENDKLACIHFEHSFKKEDIILDNLVSKMADDEPLKASVMCALWKRDSLLKVFDIDKNPWEFESANNRYAEFDHYISTTGDIINWGKNGDGYQLWGIVQGKWTPEAVLFFEENNIKLDLQRGVKKDPRYPEFFKAHCLQQTYIGSNYYGFF